METYDVYLDIGVASGPSWITSTGEREEALRLMHKLAEQRPGNYFVFHDCSVIARTISGKRPMAHP